MKKIYISLACLLSFSFLNAQVFVNQNAIGSNDGSSWENAYTEIYTAIAVTPENQDIWIAQGTYLAGENDSTYLSPAYGVSLYGGFVGTETNVEDRNWQVNPTIISGDLNQDDESGNFEENRMDNSRHIMFIPSGIDVSTVIDGIIFQGGNTIGVDGSGDDRRGGAILAYGGPSISNCLFRDNFGYFGGACYPRFEGATGSVFENCSFIGNSAGLGGAMYINSLDTASFINLVFSENRSTFNGGAVYHQATKGYWENCDFNSNQCGSDNRGGALYNVNAELLINNSVFSSNAAFRTGGAIQFYNDSDTLYSVINNCEFSNNSSRWGGAITSYDSLNILKFNSCVFNDNQASASGGAISVGFQSTVELFDCLLKDNQSEGSGGAIFCQNENTKLECDSTDFVTNQAQGAGGAISAASGQLVSITNSYLESNGGSLGGAINMGEDSMDIANLNLEATTILGNVADSQGGGLNIFNADVYMVNCLIAFNFADGIGTGGGISQNGGNADGDSMLIVHSTIANNIGALTDGIAQWTDENDTTEAKIYLMNSILSNEGLNYAIEDGNPTIISFGGNLSSDESLIDALNNTNDMNDMDAEFVDDEDFDWHLTEESPAIDMAIDSPVEVDIEGNFRTGVPDIGAYEYQGLVFIEKTEIQDFDISYFQENDHLKITLDAALKGDGNFKLYQQNGQLIKKARFSKQLETQQFDLDLHYLPSGLYYLTTQLDGKQLNTISVLFLNK